ncbi:hypothetical protein [Pseudomonas monteilii]|uniref:hypothetical protein n=1 Tax=Pseudomonas monteilii TaxID=76759 RepID=UPI00383B84B2
MKLTDRLVAILKARRKITYAELSDWKLMLIGVPNFLVGAYYLWVSGNSTIDLVQWSKDHAITWDAALAFVFVGLIALSGLYFATVARRCYELIYERNFK